MRIEGTLFTVEGTLDSRLRKLLPKRWVCRQLPPSLRSRSRLALTMSCLMGTTVRVSPAFFPYDLLLLAVWAPLYGMITSVFFDLRPAGGKPIHHYQLGGTRHLATVLASLGVRAPSDHVLTCDVADVDGFITTVSGATVTVWSTPAGRDADPDDESDPMQGEDSDSEPADDDIDSADLTDDAPPAPPPPPRNRNRRYSRTSRRMGRLSCYVSAKRTLLAVLVGAQPIHGFAGTWRGRFYDDAARPWSTFLSTSADVGLCSSDGLYTGMHADGFAAWPWSTSAALAVGRFFIAMCQIGLLAGPGVCAVALAGTLWRRYLRCHKGNDGDSAGHRHQQVNEGTGHRPRQYPVSPQRLAQRDIPQFQVDRPVFVQQPHARVHREWHFLLLGPELSKEHVAVRLSVPCDVPTAAAVVNEARRVLYGLLIPVTPQPSDEYGTLIALPSGAGERCVVCFDSRECDHRIFCRMLPQRMNRESLLIAAGFSASCMHGVYFGSSWVPLGPSQLVMLSQGVLISIVPTDRMFRPGVSLPLMLLRTEHWVADPNLPQGDFGRSYLVLTDAMPALLDARNTTRDTFRQAVADLLRADLLRVTIQASMPSLADYEYLGRQCHSVIVATERIDRTPVPPGRIHRRPDICFVDARPLLRGVSWVLHEHGRIAIDVLLQAHGDFVPLGYSLNVLGGVVERAWDSTWIRVWPGQVIVLHLRPIDPSEDESDDGSDPGTDHRRGPADGGEGHTEDRDLPEEPAHARGPAAAGFRTPEPTRARTPRRDRTGRRWSVQGTPGLGKVLLWGFVGLFCLQRLPGVRAVQLCRAYAGDAPMPENTPIQLRARPVPTPCRNAPIGPGMSSGPHVGPTLLEQSRAETHDWPLWQARTLLETLVQHEAEQEREREQHDRFEAPAVHTGPPVISLANHLPAFREFNLSAVSMNIGHDIDDVLRLFQNQWVLDWTFPEHMVLHPATQAALAAHLADTTPSRTPPLIEIFTDGSYDGHRSYWAFAVIACWPQGCTLLGHARGIVALEGDDLFIGADVHSALNGESSALFWAVAWTLQLPQQSVCFLWSDCLVAKGQCEGSYSMRAHATLGRACRAIVLAAESAGRLSSDSFSHVKAHRGHPYNELVDVLAKHGGRNPTVIPPAFASLSQWVIKGDIHWLWLLVDSIRNPHSWPTFQGSALVDDRRTMPAPGTLHLSAFGPWVGGSQRQPAPADPTTVCFAPSFASFNVQTLQEDRDSAVPGRVPYIREQLDYLRVCIAGLQETRSRKAETVVSATHLRYLSPRDEQGGHGVELWLSRRVPFAWRGQTPMFLCPEDVRVLHWCPRTLFARIIRGMTRFVVVVLHAPTSADPQREAWWRSFRQRLQRTTAREPVVLLGDFNARLLQEVPGRIGSLVWESGKDAPEALIDILTEHDLWVPSTFQDCHVGDSVTWLSPGTGAASRIDFVMIPCQWGCGHGGSYVLQDLDIGQKSIDHFGVCVQAQARFEKRQEPPRKAHRIDATRLAGHDAKTAIAAICSGLPEVPWHVDAHTHYDQVATYLVQELAKVFPAQRAVRKRTFFSDSTWELRQQRVWLRKTIRRLRVSLCTSGVRTAFSCWRFGRPYETVAGDLGPLLRQVAEAACHAQDLRTLQSALRKAIVEDKRRYTHEVAQQAVSSSTKDTVQKLRPLIGPPRRKQRGAAALPAICLEDGSLAPDKASADERWLRHFSGIESGAPTDPRQHVVDCLGRQAALDLEEIDLDPKEVPSRLDIETSMHKAPCNRASGSDLVPADVLHHHTAALSKAIFQITLKASFRLEEPLHWKGGMMHAIWKQRGCQTSCDSYRAILVSSAVGKVFHGALRDKCAGLLDVVTTPLQVGGRQGQPVVLAAQAVRAFQALAHDSKKSSAILFLDLREAFHRVARPLLYGGELSDTQVASVVRDLGLEPDTMGRLHTFVRQQSLIEEGGSSTWTARVLQETSADSWFSFNTSERIAAVHSGTRPGDNLADMLFTFLFAEVSKRLRNTLRDAGIRVELPWHPEWLLAPPGSGPIGDSTASPLDVTWMDDLAVLLWADGPEQLVEALRTAATATLDSCIQALLLPNLKAGKTEALLHLVGPHSRQLREQIFAGAEPSLELPDSIWKGARLRLVASYKHLGGVLHVDGKLNSELRSRIGSAWQAFRRHRRKVFASPIIHTRDKSLLFSTLVESTLFFGVGAWPRVKDAELHKFQAALVAMARNMLRPHFSLTDACHLSAQFVMSSARILTARSAFHVARLRYFRSVVAKANCDLWAILRQEESWCRHMQASLCWLQDKLSWAGGSGSDFSDWGQAVDFIRTRPTAWRRTVQKGKRIALLQELWEAEVQQYQGMTYRALVNGGATVPSELSCEMDTREVCGLCGCMFESLREWSHHAFKRHGRVKESRLLVAGKQCPVCLHHFACNSRLCQHIDHSTRCRWALKNAGVFGRPEPGKGSKKYDDGKHLLQPALQAHGPTCQWDFTPGVEEKDRPSEAVLRRLEDLFHDGAAFSDTWPVLLQRYRECFSVACLQRTRLRATALQWQRDLTEALELDEDISVQWATWHSSAARFVVDVDLVGWIGESAAVSQSATATFQQATVQLPWLDFQAYSLPVAPPFERGGACIVSKKAHIAGNDDFFRHCFLHEDCYESGLLLEFGRWDSARTAGLVLLSCRDLWSSLETPRPIKHFGDIEGHLRRLRLFSDLVRGTLYFWSRGIPSVLVLPELDCPAVAAVHRASPHTFRRNGFYALSNTAVSVGLLSCFTS